jgi:hypothetical protein
MVYTPADGSDATTLNVYDFVGRGVAMTMYNTDEVRCVAFTRICPPYLFHCRGFSRDYSRRHFF